MSNELKKLSGVISALRLLDNTMGLQQVSVLLAIAEKPNQTITELARQVGLEVSAASRNVQALSDKHWQRDKITGKRNPGLGLVVATEDAMDASQKCVTLKKQGEMLLSQIKMILGGTQ